MKTLLDAPIHSFLECTLWSLYARVYDNLRYLIGYQRLLESVAQIAAVQPHHRVVEVGCGTGNVLMRLAQESPRCLLGLDSSEPMLRRARAKLAGQSVNAVVQDKDLVRGLASLGQETVDRIIAVNVLYAVRDREAFWKEARRVIAPQGYVVVSHTDRPGSWPLVQEQLSHAGLEAFAHPGLLFVAAADVAIDVVARHGSWDFTDFASLSADAAAYGFTAEYLGRCYGGSVKGVNFLARYRPR